MQIAGRAHLQVDHRMTAETLQHMIQKADTGIDIAFPGAVEVEGDRDLGFPRFAFNGCGAHGAALSEPFPGCITGPVLMRNV